MEEEDFLVVEEEDFLVVVEEDFLVVVEEDSLVVGEEDSLGVEDFLVEGELGVHFLRDWTLTKWGLMMGRYLWSLG